MALSRAITTHHTVWIGYGQRRTVSVRYATLNDELVCWADRDLPEVAEGALVIASVHEIACGPPLETFVALVRNMERHELTPALVVSVTGNGLIHDPESQDPYGDLCVNGRFVALQPELP